MLRSAKSDDTPLPKGWPRRVRSAVVHAVSMANVAFTVSRSHAENHFNARVRLQAENDRLRREASLLREKLRIKDARMERIRAQRRPHYPPIERLAVLELRAARGWSLAQTARRLKALCPAMGTRRIARVLAPRLEPRPRWPRRSPCAKPQVLIRGRPGVRVDLLVGYHAGRKHLPLVTLRTAA